LELDWRLDGKLARFRALENPITVRRRTPVLINDIGTIRDQTTALSEDTGPVDGGNVVTSSQRSNLRTMADQEGIRNYDQATIRLAGLCGDDRFELGTVVNGCDDRLHAQGRGGDFEGVQIIVGICRHCRVEQQNDPRDLRRDRL